MSLIECVGMSETDVERELRRTANHRDLLRAKLLDARQLAEGIVAEIKQVERQMKQIKGAE